jgi:peptidyl-prolyl cis-trans isomerase SurA
MFAFFPIVVWIALGSGLLSPEVAQAQESERVIAIVNNEAITRLELRQRLKLVQQQIQQARPGDIPDEKLLEKQVLDRMIDTRLQLQMARDAGIEVSENDLDAAIARIAAGNKLDVGSFRNRLTKDGIPWNAFRQELRDDITVSRLRDQEVSARISVSDPELDVYLSKQRDVTGAEREIEQTRARHILIRTDKVVTDEEAQRKLNALRQRLRHGEDFAVLARLYSSDGSAVKGGELGWLYPGDTVPAFEIAMNALKPGEVSAPIHSPFGWHLIQVEERRLDTASPERRRMQARAALRDQKAEAAQDEWLRALRDRAHIEYRLDY